MSAAKITRLEIIDHSTQTGRVFVRYITDDEVLESSLQDDGRTLKYFISRKEKDGNN